MVFRMFAKALCLACLVECYSRSVETPCGACGEFLVDDEVQEKTYLCRMTCGGGWSPLCFSRRVSLPNSTGWNWDNITPDDGVAQSRLHLALSISVILSAFVVVVHAVTVIKVTHIATRMNTMDTPGLQPLWTTPEDADITRVVTFLPDFCPVCEDEQYAWDTGRGPLPCHTVGAVFGSSARKLVMLGEESHAMTSIERQSLVALLLRHNKKIEYWLDMTENLHGSPRASRPLPTYDDGSLNSGPVFVTGLLAPEWGSVPSQNWSQPTTDQARVERLGRINRLVEQDMMEYRLMRLLQLALGESVGKQQLEDALASVVPNLRTSAAAWLTFRDMVSPWLPLPEAVVEAALLTYYQLRVRVVLGYRAWSDRM